MTRKAAARSALSFLALLLVAAPVVAQPRPQQVEIGGKLVPLPAGDWRILGAADYAINGRLDGESGVVRSQVMGWTVGGRVIAMAVVRANAAPVRGGFGVARDCTRRDLHLARMETARGSALATCSFVTHLLHEAGPGDDPAWRQALDGLAAEGAVAPALWLLAGFRLADDDDVVDLRLLMDPALLGLPGRAQAEGPRAEGVLASATGWVRRQAGLAPPPPPSAWQRSAWAPGAVATDPDRALVVAHLLEWVDEVRTPLRLGFKGRDDLPQPEWPGPWRVAFGLAPAPAPPLGMAAITDHSPGTAALWKTVSWRLVGSTLDAAVALVFTGSAGVAGSITVIGGTVNAGAYYLHEMLWDEVTARGSAGDSITELPPMGGYR